MPAPPKPLRDHSVTLPLPERPGGNEFIVPNPTSSQPCKMTFYPPLPVPVPGSSLVAKFIDEPQQQRMRGGRAYPMGNCQLCGMPFQLDPQAPIPPPHPLCSCEPVLLSSPQVHPGSRSEFVGICPPCAGPGWRPGPPSNECGAIYLCAIQ